MAWQHNWMFELACVRANFAHTCVCVWWGNGWCMVVLVEAVVAACACVCAKTWRWLKIRWHAAYWCADLALYPNLVAKSRMYRKYITHFLNIKNINDAQHTCWQLLAHGRIQILKLLYNNGCHPIPLARNRSRLHFFQQNWMGEFACAPFPFIPTQPKQRVRKQKYISEFVCKLRLFVFAW